MEIRFRLPEWLVTGLVGLAYFVVLPLGFILITSRVASALALVPPLRGLWLLMVRWKAISELLLLVLGIATGVRTYIGFARDIPTQPWVITTSGRVPWEPRSRPKAWLWLAGFIVVAIALISLIGPTATEPCSDPSGVNC